MGLQRFSDRRRKLRLGRAAGTQRRGCGPAEPYQKGRHWDLKALFAEKAGEWRLNSWDLSPLADQG
jgi:hypothetical protein